MQRIPKDLPALGHEFEGGFLTGVYVQDGDVHALISASKKYQIGRVTWGEYGILVPGADSFFNGMANTVALAEAGNVVAQQVRELNINGRTDWCWPARDQLELMYRAFKPTAEENYVYRHGDNPSSLPVGYPYTVLCPGKTQIEIFQEGGAEAFEAARYWSSTQYSADNAWHQNFVDGSQGAYDKGYTGFVLPVRSQKL